jgi:citrate lyase subunit beta/citryl-CoA lyase
VDAILPQKPALLLLPKTGTAEDVRQADAYMTQVEERLGMERNTVGLMPLIETAMGVENAFAIATASKRVQALFLGAEDLTADLQCKRTKEGREIEYARTRLVVAARAAGIAVYDTPFTDVNDDEGIWVDARYAKALGFSGKASISPRHVEVINSVFSPTQKEVDYAYEVMEAIQLAKEQGKGAIALHGKMIDAPIVARAQRTLDMAKALGMGRGN